MVNLSFSGLSQALKTSEISPQYANDWNLTSHNHSFLNYQKKSFEFTQVCRYSEHRNAYLQRIEVILL